MQRTSSPIPRSQYQRVPYSAEQFCSASHGSYEDSVGLGSGGGVVADTSFELMSASQLRDQLRVRKLSFALCEVIKRNESYVGNINFEIHPIMKLLLYPLCFSCTKLLYILRMQILGVCC